MNIFIIPSWYPSQSQPLEGVFVKEQVDALTALRSDLTMIVSTWGHSDAEVPVRRPWRIFQKLYWRMTQRANIKKTSTGYWEIFNPALHWSHRLPFGGSSCVIQANRRGLRSAIKEFGSIDLIHAHVSYPAGHVAFQLSQEFKIPYLITEHMGPFPFSSLLRNGILKPEIKDAFRNAAASVAVSPSLAHRISSFDCGYPFVVPNLVDERRFSPGEPQSKKFVFFTLCGLSKQKGIDHLLEAIALWDPPASQFEFRIGGGGPLLEFYQSMAESLNISDRIRWLGPVSRTDAPKLFRECHVYVMPSRHETFGVVFAEAIASGKPIIATRCGGPEFIVNPDNGLLVEVGDIAGLVQAMCIAWKKWDRFCPKNIRADFEKRFSREVVVKKLVKIYRDCISNS